MSWTGFYKERLRELERQDLLRLPATALDPDEGLLDVCSNDYLGFAADDVSRETIPEVPLGAGASRLIHGTKWLHDELERQLADWTGHSDALLFTSGYACNVGVIAALGDPSGVIVSDALNHASIIDGCRLSRSRLAIVPHLDLDAIESALAQAPEVLRWVVVESYFSMDGDSPDLGRLRAICDAHGAGLAVDEAHALGVFGREGSGLSAAAGVLPDVTIGAFGKAVGAQGGFAACNGLLRQWFWNCARSLVFSTAPSPVLTALTLDRVAAVRAADDRRRMLAHNASHLRRLLGERAIPYSKASRGPIVPVLVGSADQAVLAAARLRNLGVLAQAIRPPTVPQGQARLRLTVKANHTEASLRQLADALAEALKSAVRDARDQ